MRVLVFFDLPTETNEDRKNYRHFRKFLLNNGFFMLQESVYCRMVLNQSVEKSVRALMRKNKPPKGNVQVISITEKQFNAMEFISGEYDSDMIDSDSRVVIL